MVGRRGWSTKTNNPGWQRGNKDGVGSRGLTGHKRRFETSVVLNEI